MSNEVTMDVDSQVVIDALEDTGDYRVFEDSTDGCEEAINWVLEMDMMDSTAAEFILDRLKPAEVIPYAWETYLNKTVNYLDDDDHNAINLCCDSLTQILIRRKGVDYVLDQVGLDNRINRVCTTDLPYIVNALEERRGLYIADDEACATMNLMNRIVYDKHKMENLGRFIDQNCSEESIDAMLGPIYSDKIIRHIESSIDGMVIRKKEDPTDEMAEVLLTYFDEFRFMESFIKAMRRHGVMFETIMKAYIDDMVKEEAEHESC